MTIQDDYHETARILREHERRLNDIEEASRGTVTPNYLVTLTDGVTVGDSVTRVAANTVTDAAWDDDAAGWDEGAWVR